MFIFKEVDIFDNFKDLEENFLSVVMEVFDYDEVCKFVLCKGSFNWELIYYYGVLLVNYKDCDLIY